jgi:5'-deoxynucleotidase YfbR-like HD superfamily hydrolase
LRAELRQSLLSSVETNQKNVPSFAQKLAVQPRSSATKPGAPRLIFDAPENHAEHCITVAIYAVLLAPIFNADVATVFLAALAHHFHNAYLPDSGFAGEELLGEFLPKIFENLREKCLSEIPENLRKPVRQTFALTKTAEIPEAKAFHAADVIDRVLQMRHHAEANNFTLKYALEEMELVHAGAVQAFHYEILRKAKLI